MGNCLVASPSGAENSQPSSHPSKVVSCRASSSSVPSSSLTSSTPSTLTLPSYGERTSSGSLSTPRTEGEILSASNAKSLSYSELKTATRNFRSDSFVGEGGFGCVYKGWLDEQTLAASRPDHGMVVAVKKLKAGSFQGHKEWLTEVNYLGQLHHRNLVNLIGYCTEDNTRLIVYEYMAKGSLENHLFKRSAQPLDWRTRIKVAIGAARGLSFLHDLESQVIYRDVKASNILLDSEFNAKLSDFGLARAGPTGYDTHVSTRVIGTQGYAAPEYIATGRLSAKADVYSFGVVLLELLTGRRALDRSKQVQDLVEWARPWLGDKRKLHKLIDPKLEEQYPRRGAHALALLASRCVCKEAKLRPTMAQALASLEQLKEPKFTAMRSQEKKATSSFSSSIQRTPLRVHLPPQRPNGDGVPSPVV